MTATGSGRARLSLAALSRDVADEARALVGASAQAMSAGERIARARALRRLSVGVVDRAVLVELAGGATWAEVAYALGLSVEDAQRTYGGSWNDWLDADFDDEVDFGSSAVGMPGDTDLEGTAQTLDMWWRRHAEPWECVGDDAHPVTRSLVDGQTAPGDR